VTAKEAHDETSRRRAARGENRLPPALAVLVALVVYALLPSSLQFAERFVIPGIEVLLLIALVVTNPRRITRQTRWSRAASVALALIVIATNLVALGLLISELSDPAPSGQNLLLGAMQIWLTNVIGFALLYWEIDRGGPVARRSAPRDEMPVADWRFSHDENKDTVSEVSRTASEVSGWIPLFVDYLFLSVTNSSAFSPTDTMPLSSRAKVLMAVQATAALLVSLLLVARAVGSLGT
jgi:protein-S-isoprenylcysteine O-methyltransferase Ste14